MERVATQNTFLNAVANITGVNTRSANSDVKSKISSWLMGGVASTEAGKKVTVHKSLTLSAVYCAVELLSNSLAVLPITIEKRTQKNREVLESHPLAFFLNNQVNSYLTSFMFRKTIARCLLLRGNAYAIIIRDENSGKLERLQYIPYGLVSLRYNKQTDQIIYYYNGNAYGSQDIIHFKINSEDGIYGRSVIHYAADSMGISIAAMEYGSSAYGAKGMMMGVIESDKQGISSPNKVALATGFRAQMSVKDPFRVAVLDEGMKYKKISITPQEAQFVETYANGVQDIARWFNVPPHKLMDLTNANYSNIYQMDLSFLQTGVLPYVVQFESELTIKLLSFREISENLKVNMDENSLLRMDPKMRGEFLRAMVLSGIYTQNEGRIADGKNPLTGHGYDDLLTPVNLQGQAQIQKQLSDE